MHHLKPILLAVVLIAIITSPHAIASAQTFAVIHDLRVAKTVAGRNRIDASRHRNPVGTTWYGGTYQGGTIFKLKRAGSGWTFSRFIVRGRFDSCQSDGELAFGPDGAIYGTTVYGGIGGCSGNSYGTIFRIQPQPTPPPTPLTPWNEILFTDLTVLATVHILTETLSSTTLGICMERHFKEGRDSRLRISASEIR